jgi:hypothetical protein
MQAATQLPSHERDLFWGGLCASIDRSPTLFCTSPCTLRLAWRRLFGQSFFETRALTCQQIGLILGAAMLVRLAAGPLVGMLADFLGSLRLVFATCAVLAAGTAAALLLANSFRLPFFIALVQAAALAPTTSIADALSVNAAKPQSNLNPGWCVVHICHSRDAKYSPDCDRRPVRPGANRKVRVDLGDCPEKRLARCKGLSGELPPSHGNERIGQP